MVLCGAGCFTTCLTYGVSGGNTSLSVLGVATSLSLRLTVLLSLLCSASLETMSVVKNEPYSIPSLLTEVVVSDVV